MSDHNPYTTPKANLDQPGQPPGEVGDPYPVAAGRGWGWIADGFGYFRRQPGIWIGIIVVWFAIAIVLSFVPLGSLAVTLLSPVFLGGMMLGCQADDTGQGLEFSHLFAGFRVQAGRLAAVGGLYLVGSVVIGIAAALILGLSVGLTGLDPETAAAAFDEETLGLPLVLMVLVVAALLIPLLMAVWFAPALVVFHDLSAWEAMALSFKGCLKNVLPFLVYGLIAFVLLVIAMIPLMLGLLILSPILVASVYVAYKDIFLGEY